MYITRDEVQALLCDKGTTLIRLCQDVTVNGDSLSKKSTLADLITSLDGILAGSGSFTQLTGDVTSGTNGGATTIANGAVTNAKMANVATATLKGRVAAGTGVPTDLTVSQVKTMLGVVTVVAPTTYADLAAQTTATTDGQITQNTNTGDVVIKNNSQTITILNTPFNAVTPTTYADLTAQTTATPLNGITKNTATNDIVFKDLNGDVITLLGSTVVENLVRSNGTEIRYRVVTSNPTVTFTKSAGTGTVNVTGGTIEILSMQVDIVDPTDTTAGHTFTIVCNGLRTRSYVRYPLTQWVNTNSGAAASSGQPHIYKATSSAPLVSVTSTTTGSSSAMTFVTGDVSVFGTTCSLIIVFF